GPLPYCERKRCISVTPAASASNFSARPTALGRRMIGPLMTGEARTLERTRAWSTAPRIGTLSLGDRWSCSRGAECVMSQDYWHQGGTRQVLLSPPVRRVGPADVPKVSSKQTLEHL